MYVPYRPLSLLTSRPLWWAVRADPRQAWEFKHPEFNQHKKDNLDNIRLKAPAPRKAAAAVEEPSLMVVHQANLFNE